jgi:hypothetical protein
LMDELTRVALIGTSKYAGPLPGSDHPAIALCASLADDDRERSLLLQFGARSIYDLAGREPVTGIEPLAAAPPETKKTASAKLARLLQTAASDSTDLLIDFLRQLQARQVVLPHEVLPLLLQSREPEVRRCLIPVLGERGLWLSRQNSDWSYAHKGVPVGAHTDLDELRRSWDDGTIDERCQAVAILRRMDPVAARDWVARAFAQEKPNHRVRLLESLRTGLCDDDEAFLEACLFDRSSAVVQAAAQLLWRLPRSSLAGRMRDRATAMLALETRGFVFKKVKLVCTPPRAIEQDWERDGIPKKAPPGQGDRAFWTEAVLSAVAPSHWHNRFGLDPPALIAAVADETFAASILAGWTQAAVSFSAADAASAEWLAPLWRHWAGAVRAVQGADRVRVLGRMQALFALMPADRAEKELEVLFESAPGWDDVEVLNFSSSLPRPWSSRFSAEFLATVRRRARRGLDEAAYRWVAALARTACAIPADAFPLALAPWDVAAPLDATSWFASAIPTEIDKFIATIEARRSFMMELDQ